MSKKDDILESALELFADRGYHGTSVGLIMEQAGVAAGTVYRHFKDKQDLINVLYRHWKTEFEQVSNQGLKDESTPRQTFLRLWKNMLGFARQYPKQLTFLELHHHAPYLDEESQQLVARHYEKSLKWWGQLREDQVIKDAPPQLFRALMSGMFFGLLKAAKSDWLDLNDDLTQWVDLISWEAFRA